MKNKIAIVLILSLLLYSCKKNENPSIYQENDNYTKDTIDTYDQSKQDNKLVLKTYDQYAKDLSFDDLDDQKLERYVEDRIYSELLSGISDSGYYIENIESKYISKEYIEQLEYNSKANIYFGYTLEELENQFQGKKYIFTLSDEGETIVVPLEEYDDTYNKVLKNITIGTGVILICITVSAITAGVGAPAISMIFAVSAKSASTLAISSGIISGVASGVVKGMETGDYNEALKSAALSASEGFKCGAITGAISGGSGETIA